MLSIISPDMSDSRKFFRDLTADSSESPPIHPELIGSRLGRAARFSQFKLPNSPLSRIADPFISLYRIDFKNDNPIPTGRI
jgi:hypothetical protein